MAEDRCPEYRKTPITLQLSSVQFTNNLKELKTV